MLRVRLDLLHRGKKHHNPRCPALEALLFHKVAPALAV